MGAATMRLQIVPHAYSLRICGNHASPSAQVVCTHYGKETGRLLPATERNSFQYFGPFIVDLRCPTGNERNLNSCSWALGTECTQLMGVVCKGDCLDLL